MKRICRVVLETFLPRGFRARGLKMLDKYRGPQQLISLETASIVIGGYRIQLIDAFNASLFVAELLLTIFCFGEAALPEALALALASILTALTFRDVYTHRLKLPLHQQYLLDMAGDAVTAMVFLLTTQALARKVNPSLALTTWALYHGGLIWLPMISIMRMVLRPRPALKPAFEESTMSAEGIFRRVWLLNVMWMGAFNGMMVLNVSDVDGSWRDFFLSAGPLLTWGIWVAIQRNALDRRRFIETLFTKLRNLALGRKKETLPQGINKGEPHYGWYVALQVLLFVEFGLAMLPQVWPLLSGQDTNFTRPAVAMTAFAATVLSWKYVRESNQTAARALAAEIAR
jgi:hypothetical protein